jgi:hypothetical protein
MTRLINGKIPGERESSSMTLSEYMDALVNSDTEAARPFVDLLSSSWVRAIPLHRDEDPSAAAAEGAAAVWIVSASATPDLVLTEWALAGVDRRTDSEAGAALRRLADAIPSDDWHVASTLRADVQHWLSRRPVGNDLLRTVYA